MPFTYQYRSPLGPMLIACDESALIGAWFLGATHFAATLPPNSREQEHPLFERTTQWFDTYFSGTNPGDIPPARFIGTPFQKVVWEELQKIPWGGITSYRDLGTNVAARLGKKRMAAQAIGAAVARNPFTILVPCHRVVSINGDLTGYAGGIERKRALLALEKTATPISSN